MLVTGRISPRTPQMTVVSPVRMTAEPWACEREEVWIWMGRASEGRRPLVRPAVGGSRSEEEDSGARLRRRKGWGESLAKTGRGKVKAGCAMIGIRSAGGVVVFCGFDGE